MAILLLTLSLSLDSLGIGLTYGLRNIRLPFLAKAIMSLVSFFITLTTVSIGVALLKIIPAGVTSVISLIILVATGVWVILQSFKPKPEERTQPTVHNIIIKSLGLTIQIIRDPKSGDMDNSSSIEPVEALYIGTALSLDSIGAGIAAAAFSFSLAIPFSVALGQFLMLSVGHKMGQKISSIKMDSRVFSVTAGVLLIFIGLLRVL